MNAYLHCCAADTSITEMYIVDRFRRWPQCGVVCYFPLSNANSHNRPEKVPKYAQMSMAIEAVDKACNSDELAKQKERAKYV